MKKSELRQIIREEYKKIIIKEMYASDEYIYWEDVFINLVELGADSSLLNSVNKKYRKYIADSFKKKVNPKKVAEYIKNKG